MLKKRIKRIIENPLLIILHLCYHRPFNYISDEAFIKLHFKAYQGYNLNLIKPKTFNEKLQWLKLYDRNPKYTSITDKYLVREFVKEKIGEEYLIPLLGVWDNAKQINFKDLPNQFVLKCNHDSGSVIICKDKEKINTKKVIKKINKLLKKQYYWKSREYNYKDINPKVIAEKYMIDEEGQDLKDYKIFCFNGEPKFIQVDIGRFTNHVRNFYTTEWNFIPVEFGKKNNEKIIIEKPSKLKEMLYIAKQLSSEIPMARVDLYVIKGEVYFGEITFHHGGGGEKIEPFEYDEKWGNFINLDNLINKRND